MRKYFFIFLLLSFILSCKKQTDDAASIDTTYNYFPVDIGHVWIYDVDSLVYDDNTGSTRIDTFNYQYKETTTANITDDMGKPAQILERYYRKNDSDIWVSANNWIICRDNLRAQKIQENIRYVKLVFPLNANQSWEGNMFNNKDSTEIYTIDYFDQPSTVNGKTYEKTAKVLQVENVNAIEEIRRYEIYARNIGMIYFQSDSINTQFKPDAVSRGLRYRLKLKSFQ